MLKTARKTRNGGNKVVRVTCFDPGKTSKNKRIDLLAGPFRVPPGRPAENKRRIIR